MKDKLIKLVEKEGFILFLFVSVCVVAGGTLFLSMRNLSKVKYNTGNGDFVILEGYEEEMSSLNDEDMNTFYLSDREIGNIYRRDELEEIVEVMQTEEDYLNSDEELEFIEDAEEIGGFNQVESLILPLDGNIITEFTSNSLIYSETLESWVGHEAIDISGNIGDPVKAAMDGKIKEVYEDDLWGIVIVIDHGNEILTRYSNLATKEMVKEGLQVKRGDHISKVGNTTKIEMLMDSHIHFELIKNGKLADPRSIMD